jgi:hypothetical protein
VAAERLLSPAPHVYHGELQISNWAQSPIVEHTYLLLTHVSHLEPTFPIAPRQSPLFPTISAVEIGPMSGERLMSCMQGVYDNSKHLDMEDVKFVDGVENVKFWVDEDEARWRRICIDGDMIIVEKGAMVSVMMTKGIDMQGGSLVLHI